MEQTNENTISSSNSTPKITSHKTIQVSKDSQDNIQVVSHKPSLIQQQQQTLPFTLPTFPTIITAAPQSQHQSSTPKGASSTMTSSTRLSTPENYSLPSKLMRKNDGTSINTAYPSAADVSAPTRLTWDIRTQRIPELVSLNTNASSINNNNNSINSNINVCNSININNNINNVCNNISNISINNINNVNNSINSINNVNNSISNVNNVNSNGNINFGNRNIINSNNDYSFTSPIKTLDVSQISTASPSITMGTPHASRSFSSESFTCGSLFGESAGPETVRAKGRVALSKHRGQYTEKEDRLITEHVRRYGPSKWSVCSEALGGKRSAKQCRERWTNKLNPAINNAEWTSEEETRLFKLVGRYGTKWTLIAKELGTGRTDNAVKNHWNSRNRSKKKNPGQNIPASPSTSALSSSSSSSSTSSTSSSSSSQQHRHHQRALRHDTSSMTSVSLPPQSVLKVPVVALDNAEIFGRQSAVTSSLVFGENDGDSGNGAQSDDDVIIMNRSAAKVAVAGAGMDEAEYPGIRLLTGEKGVDDVIREGSDEELCRAREASQPPSLTVENDKLKRGRELDYIRSSLEKLMQFAEFIARPEHPHTKYTSAAAEIAQRAQQQQVQPSYVTAPAPADRPFGDVSELDDVTKATELSFIGHLGDVSVVDTDGGAVTSSMLGMTSDVPMSMTLAGVMQGTHDVTARSLGFGEMGPTTAVVGESMMEMGGGGDDDVIPRPGSVGDGIFGEYGMGLGGEYGYEGEDEMMGMLFGSGGGDGGDNGMNEYWTGL